MRRAWFRAFVTALPPVLLVTVFLVTGLRGIDFGLHWDEVDWQVKPVEQMVRTGVLMPAADIYPAFAKWLVLSPALARGAQKALEVGLEPRIIQAAMLRAITAPDYLLTARSLFVVVSALSIVWVYAAALVARLRVWEATVAASVLGLSWEFAYHARWVATDCIVVQFSALTVLLLLAFLRWGRLRWLYGAAVSAGLAIGTKFPAVPLLVPVVVIGMWQVPGRRHGERLVRATLLSGTAFLAYLVSTPATVFDPFTFVERLRYIAGHYEAGHYGHTVKPGWDHFSKVITYFGVSYFSPYPFVSLVLFATAIAGGVVWGRASRKEGVLLVGFPLLFLAFFCGRYSAMIVRNYLLIVPFLALLVARGAGFAVDRMPRPWLRIPLFAALAGVAMANAVFLVRAAESIRHASLEGEMAQAIRYLAASGSRFQLSPRLAEYAARSHLPVGDRTAERVAFLVRAEGPGPWTHPATDPFQFERVFGPLEVNYDWYPGWFGPDRVAVMSQKKAAEIGAPFARSSPGTK